MSQPFPTCVTIWIYFRWTTHWFKVEAEIPSSWVGKEVLFLWDSMSEAMIWKDGQPVQVKFTKDETDFVCGREQFNNSY